MPTKFAMRLLAGTAVSALLTGVSFAAEAEARPFDIPQQDAATALQAFAMQSGRQVLFPYEAAKGKTAPEVKGDYSDEEVVALLAASAGLKVTADDGRTVTLRPQFAQAAEAGGGSEVEALIVTAQKREEDIQDVPIAISAFTQDDLTRSQVAGGPDLMTQVPNMTFTKTNFTSYSIQIRGIGTQAISATTDPAVAVAFNNTPFIRNRFFEQEFYDLQRVEVLRGPQGTLYGRNATAGVVNVISAKPHLRDFEAKLSGDVSNYSSTRVEGMINLPLVEDVAALRFAAAWTKRNGYVTNEITGNPIDGRDLWSARATLRFEPVDGFRANLIYEHFEEDDDRLRSGKQLCKTHEVTEYEGREVSAEAGIGGGAFTVAALSLGCQAASLYSPDSFQVPNGWALPYYVPFSGNTQPQAFKDFFNPYASATQSHDLRVIESTVDPHYKAESDLAELQIAIDLGSELTLESETAYNRDFTFGTQDFNRFNTKPGAFQDEIPPFGSGRSGVQGVLNDGYFCDPQIGCANRLVAVDLATAKSRQFSQEIRLSSDFDAPINFSLGGNFLRYDTEDKYYVFINSLTLFAAVGQTGAGSINFDRMPDYIPNVSDNSQCLIKGMLTANPLAPQSVVGCVYIDPNPIDQLNDLGHNYFLSKNPYKLISYAVFGEAYYGVTPTLNLTAGLRFTVDKKEAPRIPSWLLAANTVGYPVMEVIRQKWSEPTGRIALDWKPDLGFTDETLIYGSYARGYKAGGANPPPAVIATAGVEGADLTKGLINSIVQPKTFDAEFVDAYELGAKSTLLNGQVVVNLASFYYDYKNYQTSQIINRSAVNYNFDAQVWGLEVEADWRPMENLRLGLKFGYEGTRIGDGEEAIDVMDRTAGHDDWVAIRPFPTVPSNCIVPRSLLINSEGNIDVPHWINAGLDPGPCTYAYLQHLDPVTLLPYVANPAVYKVGFSDPRPLSEIGREGYAGFNPLTAPNNGEGFTKDLSGNELPNAPHYTATITGDWTIPLPTEWLMTLHADLYYQSEAWTRVFNTEGYDKLKAYTNVNVAAIFSNEDAGWRVMAYVKNVFDKDNITGAFLNSDDTGLTTNVFLNEPRLYGLRVTKEWAGQPWWTTTARHAGAYPLTLELGAQVQRHDARNAALAPAFLDTFPTDFQPDAVQDQDLDWGDGREIAFSYKPEGRWSVSASARFGKTNAAHSRSDRQDEAPVCRFTGLPSPFPTYCGSPRFTNGAISTPTRYLNSQAVEREEHQIIDFAVGREFELGALDSSVFQLGLRYAHLSSTTAFETYGVADWNINQALPLAFIHHDEYRAQIAADREFEGIGPVATWDAAVRLLGTNANHLDLAWTTSGGVLFGRQKVGMDGEIAQEHFYGKYFIRDSGGPRYDLQYVNAVPADIHRSERVIAPTIAATAGLAWEVDRFRVSAGYRWERYFDVMDGGHERKEDVDRTIDGPYFKIAVGFGG